MKNLFHFSITDHGGASSAALRTHKNFQRKGFNSIFFCRDSSINDPSIINIKPIIKDLYLRLLHRLESIFSSFDKKYYFFDKNRYLVTKISQLEKHITFHPDVIILYWISGFVDLKVINQLKKKYNCKVFWYLVDMAPMTGGCHFSWDCHEYMHGCQTCPAVGPIHKNLPSLIFKFKEQMIKEINLEPISWTSWSTNKLKKSQLYKNQKLHEIMLSINSNIFKPLDDKNILKLKLKYNLPVDKKIIFFGASNTTEERKGLSYFIESMKLISNNNSLDMKEIIIITAGKEMIPKDYFENIKYQYKHLGYLDGDIELSNVYQLSTVFVSPSIEDFGPMMINESIMCGTPVVSFKMGVAEDLVLDNKTGYIASLKNIKDLANKIIKIIKLDHQKYKLLKENCRQLALNEFSEDVQIQKLVSLMDEIK